jgi:hypothetical protein
LVAEGTMQEFAARLEHLLRLLRRECACDDQTADHACHRADRLLVAAARRDHVAQPRDPRANRPREVAPNFAACACPLRADRRDGASHFRLCGMPRAQISIDHGPQTRPSVGGLGPTGESRESLPIRVLDRLAQEVVLGLKMRIEAAVRETGGGHDVSDADAGDPLGA